MYLQRHLADARRSAGGRRQVRAARDVRRAVRRRLGQEPQVERDRRRAKASSTSGTPTSTYIQEPPFLVDLHAEAGADSADPRRALPGGVRRLGDDRPHLAGRLDRQGQPRGQVPHLARRRAARLQQLRRPPRQRPRDDPRHVRQHSHPQPARARHRRRRHAAPARRRGDVDLRRGDEVQGRGRAAGRAGRRRIRQRLEPRLGRQGAVPAGRAGRASPPASSASTAATS